MRKEAVPSGTTSFCLHMNRCGFLESVYIKLISERGKRLPEVYEPSCVVPRRHSDAINGCPIMKLSTVSRSSTSSFIFTASITRSCRGLSVARSLHPLLEPYFRIMICPGRKSTHMIRRAVLKPEASSGREHARVKTSQSE